MEDKRVILNFYEAVNVGDVSRLSRNDRMHVRQHFVAGLLQTR